MAWTALNTANITSNTSTITWSSIPSNYKSLIIRGVLRSDNTSTGYDALLLSFNGDTNGANYSRTQTVLTNGGLSLTSNTATNALNGYVANSGGDTSFSYVEIIIFGYNTATNKAFQAMGGTLGKTAATSYYGRNTCSWSNTNTINSITLQVNGGYNFVNGSNIYLYGIN